MPSLEVSLEYREAFVKAEQTFLYQLIYDPKQRKLAPLTPYPPNVDPSLMPFAGHYMDENIAFQLALGNLDAETLEKLDTYNPDTVVQKRNQSFTTHLSIWSKNFTIQQDSSLSYSVESESAKTIATMCKKTTATIEYSIPKTAEQAPNISDHELTSQYAKNESPSSPILTARKRKRADENCSPSQNQARWSIESALRAESPQSAENVKSSMGVPTVLDPFAEPIVPSTKSGSEDSPTTPLRKSNPFVKLKTQSSDTKTSPQTSPATTSHFSALQTFSQLRKLDANGQEIVTSTYFQSEKVTVTNQLRKNIGCDTHIALPINSSQATYQPFKPVVGTKSPLAPTEVHFCQLTPLKLRLQRNNFFS